MHRGEGLIVASRRGWPVQKYTRISSGRYANGILAVLLSQNHHTLTYLMRRARTHATVPLHVHDMHTHTVARMRKLCTPRVIDPRIKHSHVRGWHLHESQRAAEPSLVRVRSRWWWCRWWWRRCRCRWWWWWRRRRCSALQLQHCTTRDRVFARIVFSSQLLLLRERCENTARG